MKKLGFLAASLFVLSAQAAHLVLPVNVVTSLPSCGGSVETSRSASGQINIVFRQVKDCSNFDILSTDFGILDAGYKSKKLQDQGRGNRGGSFTIPQVYIDRGMNAIRVEVKSNSGAHKDTIDLLFVAGRPTQPGPRPLPPVQHGSLKGFCPDHDHSNFAEAKRFAYSTSGLNMSDSAAINWALDYQRSHRCGTIQEYQARYVELKGYAYSTSFMNKSDSEAKVFALENVETTSVNEVQGWKATFPHIQSFLYSTSYLNMSSGPAALKADQWVRRYCGNQSQIDALKAEYTREYQFAYSTSGLNMSSSAATQYAIQKISRSTRCSDLFR